MSQTSNNTTTHYGVFMPNFGPFFDPNAMADLASAAEQTGWDGFFIWDHILWSERGGRDNVPVADPWVMLAAVASCTTRLLVGALVTPVARRSPWKLARETVTLDHLSGGRLVFGAGLGFAPEVEFEPFGMSGDARARADLLDEGLEVIAKLWSGDPCTHRGTAYQLDLMPFLPRPVQQPRIPVWIAGGWPNLRPLRRAARWDGVFPESSTGGPPPIEDLRAIVAYVREQGAADRHFDVVLSGRTEANGRAARTLLDPLEDAGMTWWLEKMDSQRRYSLAEARERVLEGPPR
jgi:alkanesulfonate monooxygenase SsuD/methylene tetrahydromethanopterin reductase-like flavin-dependent oxidoreductase (luciferase family)